VSVSVSVSVPVPVSLVVKNHFLTVIPSILYSTFTTNPALPILLLCVTGSSVLEGLSAEIPICCERELQL